MDKRSLHICCHHIKNGERDILLVIRNDRGFEFLCGADHDLDEDPELITLENILKLDKSIFHILELKKNHIIERESINDFWSYQYDHEHE
jgi:hypothetical protein